VRPSQKPHIGGNSSMLMQFPHHMKNQQALHQWRKKYEPQQQLPWTSICRKVHRANRPKTQETHRDLRGPKEPIEEMGPPWYKQKLSHRDNHTEQGLQQQEGLVEDITSQPESDAEKRQMEVGTSSEPPRRKGKNPWCGHRVDILMQQ
jgi:hypothetical protein